MVFVVVERVERGGWGVVLTDEGCFSVVEFILNKKKSWKSENTAAGAPKILSALLASIDTVPAG